MSLIQRLLIVTGFFLTIIWLYSQPRTVPQVKLVDGLDEKITTYKGVIVCTGCNPLIFGERLNVNTASVVQLSHLPGIGEKIANEIVKQRPFKNLQELDAVKGIGPATLAKIESDIRFRP